MARGTKRLWTDAEKRSICLQTTAPGVLVAQLVQRYVMNANLFLKWPRDPRYAPEPSTEPDVACFRPVEIVDRPVNDDRRDADDPAPSAGGIEIDVAGGHRLPVVGGYDPETLARLIRGLSG